MANTQNSEWRDAWRSCRDTLEDMKSRGVFKTSFERLWELVGGAVVTAVAVIFRWVPNSWPSEWNPVFYGIVFVVATIVLWYLRCVHGLPAKERRSAQLLFENQRRMIAWLGGSVLTHDESQQWVAGSNLFDFVAWAETDQSLSKLLIEHRITDEAKKGRLRVRAMSLNSSDLVELAPSLFEDHVFVLEPRTNRFVARFGKNEANAFMWGSIFDKSKPPVKVYDCPQFERAKIDAIWKQPGVEEFRKRRLLITADRDMSEDEARAHLTRFFGNSSSYGIDSAISQAIQDEHITAWGRNGVTEVWKKIEKDQIAKAFPLFEYVPHPDSAVPARLYSELSFSRRECELRWMIFD